MIVDQLCGLFGLASAAGGQDFAMFSIRKLMTAGNCQLNSQIAFDAIVNRPDHAEEIWSPGV